MSGLLRTLLFAVLVWRTNGLSQVFARDASIVNYPSETSGLTNLDNLQGHTLLVDNDTLIVGGRNHIMQIKYKNKDPNAMKTVRLSPDPSVFASCRSMKPKELCSNHIKVLVNTANTVLACGTNAGQPKCWNFAKDTFTLLVDQNVTGVSRCPSDPRQNVTNVQVGNLLFTGVRLGPSDYGIAKTGIPALKEQVRTMNGNPTFYDANFVSSFQADDGFLYFFFREVAMEVIDRQIVYSRVARVCPYDVGEPFVFENKFITFLKSQLVCVKHFPSQPSVYYDLLQSTYHVAVHTNATFAEDFIYGIFTSSFNPQGSSAVCRFRMVDIQKTFATSSFLQKNTANGYWEPVQHPQTYPDVGRLNCTADLETFKYGSNSAHFATSHPLLADDVMPYDKDAVFAIDGASLTSLVVDDIHQEGYKKEVHVLFASTLDGRVLKILIDRSIGKPPVFLEEIFAFKTPQPLYAMEKINGYVFVAGNSGVSQIALSRCHQYQLCGSCVLSNDPYCGWSKSLEKCITVKGKDNGLQSGDIVVGSAQSCPSVNNDTSCNVQIVKLDPGSGAVLQCEVQGPASAAVIGWTKDNVNVTALDNNAVYKTEESGAGKQKLVLLQMSLKETGTYACIVSGGSSTQQCSIAVTGSPPTMSCTGPASTVSNLVAQCQCHVDGNPMPTLALVKGNRTSAVSGQTVLINSGEALFVVSAFGQAGFICPSFAPTPVTPKPRKDPEDCPPNYQDSFVVMAVLFGLAALFCAILLFCICCARVQSEDQQDNSPVRGIQWKVFGSKKLVVNPSLRLRTVPERQSGRKALIGSHKGTKDEAPFQYVCTPTAEELKPINSKQDSQSLDDQKVTNHVDNTAA